jgi:hypothetical protein
MIEPMVARLVERNVKAAAVIETARRKALSAPGRGPVGRRPATSCLSGTR